MSEMSIMALMRIIKDHLKSINRPMIRLNEFDYLDDCFNDLNRY